VRFCLTLAVLAAGVLASATPSSAQGVRVRIELLDVRCLQDTESPSDSDLFYAVAALTDGTAKNTRTTVTEPIAFHIGESKPVAADQRVVFDATVPAQGSVRGGMRAFNEDFLKDWSVRKSVVDRATNAVAAAVAAHKDGSPITGASVLKTALDVYNPSFLWTSRRGDDGRTYRDEDTTLGTLELNVPADGPAEETKEWTMAEKTVGANTYEYKVRYRVVRTK